MTNNMSTAIESIQSLVKALEAGGYNAAPAPPNKPENKDLSNYPHKCPNCSGPAYIGFSAIDCKNQCK